MEDDRFVVKNNTKTILVLSKNKIKMGPGEVIDLISRTGKSLQELDRDPEIKLNLAYRNLVLIDKFDSRPILVQGAVDTDLSKKIDALMEMVSNKGTIEIREEPIAIDSILEVIRLEMSKIKGRVDKEGNPVNVSKEEEEMRLKAIKQMIKHDKKVNKNFDKFGKERKNEEESEDFSDIIDF